MASKQKGSEPVEVHVTVEMDMDVWAKRFTKEALDMADSDEKLERIMSSLSTMGVCAKVDKRMDKHMLNLLDQAIALVKRLEGPSSPKITDYLERQGDLHCRIDKLHDGRKCFEAIIAHYKTFPIATEADKQRVVRAHAVLGELQESRDNPVSARSYFALAQSFATKYCSPDDMELFKIESKLADLDYKIEGLDNCLDRMRRVCLVGIATCGELTSSMCNYLQVSKLKIFHLLFYFDWLIQPVILCMCVVHPKLRWTVMCVAHLATD